MSEGTDLREAAAARVDEIPAETAGGRQDPADRGDASLGGPPRRTNGDRVRDSGAAGTELHHPSAGRPGFRLPILGRLPIGKDNAVFVLGVGTLAVVGALDWPVAAAIGIGHVILRRSQSDESRRPEH